MWKFTLLPVSHKDTYIYMQVHCTPDKNMAHHLCYEMSDWYLGGLICHSHPYICTRDPPPLPFKQGPCDLTVDCDQGGIARFSCGILQWDELEKLNENIRMWPWLWRYTCTYTVQSPFHSHIIHFFHSITSTSSNSLLFCSVLTITNILEIVYCVTIQLVDFLSCLLFLILTHLVTQAQVTSSLSPSHWINSSVSTSPTFLLINLKPSIGTCD